MIPCPACSRPAPEGSRFCPSCATSLDAVGAATRTSVPGTFEGPTLRASAPSQDDARFVPGAVVAGRYRIVGLLGRGGMGEVYRADDLTLGQPVALKFLPPSLQQDPSRRARFLTEVKLARQVSHPSVCRVHDVGETEGQHYLSMEYVDGEDLASLLRRIGRLPQDRAIRLARQLCAGLAAAHEQGILHRDLKPANVMVDGRGRAKITDFGLASLAEAVEGAEARAGTPGYMAPEQLDGREATLRSDVYSLGLVLYELFTGEPAFRADSVAALARLQHETMPASPSSHVDGFDPAVERIILRCLDKDPSARPSSALAVAAALPGGDPLAAALAAGETPSPELVAAAGETVGLSRWLAWSCLALIAIGLPVAVLLLDRVMLYGSVPLPLTPDVLRAKARGVLSELGYSDDPADFADGLAYNEPYLDYLQREAAGQDWGQLLGDTPPAILYWYRQSPERLLQSNPLASRPTWASPPQVVPGMVAVQLDPRGRLVELLRVPTDADVAEGDDAGEVDWTPLFAAAELDPGSFTPVPPTTSPLVYADRLAAWDGAYTAQPGTPLHVAAAALGGRPVRFQLRGPWVDAPEPGPASTAGAAFGTAFLVGMMITAGLMARHNVRRGRGDRRGATRLALAFFVIQLAYWLLRARHVAALSETTFLFANLAMLTLVSLGLWTVYLALEPVVRRRWPDLLVSWARLFDGRFRDPLVGRDLLLGATFAVALVLLDVVGALAPWWAGSVVRFERPQLHDLLGGRFAVGALLGWTTTVWPALMILLLLVLFRTLTKRDWAAFLLTWGLVGGLTGATQLSQTGAMTAVYSGLFFLVFLFLLVRFGLLAGLVGFYLHGLLAHGATTSSLGAWYSDFTIGAILLIAAFALYGFWVSLAGRSLLGEHAFE